MPRVGMDVCTYRTTSSIYFRVLLKIEIYSRMDMININRSKKIVLAVMAALVCYLFSIILKPKVKSPFIRPLSKYNLKLPKIPHLTLTRKDIGDCQVFIVGDVHGCLEELEELLQSAKMKVKERNILPIFVGDLANSGPHNASTIRKIRKMHAYAVRGNHDEAVIKHGLNRLADPEYILPDTYKWTTELDEDDIKFLIELPYTISIPSKKSLIVHGGIIPGIPLEEQTLTNFITMRNIEKDDGNFLAHEHPIIGDVWASLWPGPEHVYFGHDARRKLQQHPFATGLDTGCLYGFYLTGIFIDSKTIIQVKAKKTYRDH